jgi:2-succinyl-6-hydroxy-2,4-cyclohexadiene-1-carboxylate synthase
MAGDVIGVMDHLGLRRAHIVGSSLGAEVGLSLAANHPDRIINLVCDGPPVSEFGPYSTWEGTEPEFLEHAAGQVEKLRAAPDTVYPSIDAWVAARRELFEKHMGWNEHLAAMERYAAVELEDGRYVQAFGKHALADYLSHYFHTRFEDYYRRVTCPLLLIAEGGDEVDERERVAIEGLRALAAQARVVYLSGWDHPYGWLFDPEGICRTILEFLSAAH